MWREDGRCGTNFPLTNGDPAQCDPEDPSGFSCCGVEGWCGGEPAAQYCTCDLCRDYRSELILIIRNMTFISTQNHYKNILNSVLLL